MLNRWNAWPRGIRWLAGVAAVALALAIVWALFVSAPDWLAHHDVGSTKGPLLQTARDAARGRLLTLVAGLFAAGALWFTARNFTLSREVQVTDRYTKAITQLGDEKLDVRIGGIYALERVARDSARDHPTVMEVASAFVREHSHEQWPASDPGGQEQARSTRPDVQAAVTVIGRRDAKRDIQQIDLTGADLTGADLTHARLNAARLTAANLTEADLSAADLSAADLTRANLTAANLRYADLIAAHLTGARLGGAHLDGSDLTRADLTGANLTFARLTRADLTGANLTRADLTGANFTRARWPEDRPAPEGWKLDTDSGRLKRAGIGPGPAEAN
jgi:Pentapeptide repeats (8 copies)